MKPRLCMLNVGDYFRLGDNDFTLKDKRKGICENFHTGELREFPTMMFVEKIDKPKKKKKKEDLNEQESLSDSFRLRDGLVPEGNQRIGDSANSSSPSGLEKS